MHNFERNIFLQETKQIVFSVGHTQSILIKESFFACMRLRHYGLHMARRALKIFYRCTSQGPCAPGQEFSISLLDDLKKN